MVSIDPASGRAQINVPRPPVTTEFSYKIVPTFAAADHRALIPRPSEGGEGWYHLTFVLGIPGKETHWTDVDLEAFLSSGESLLLAPEQATRLEANLANGTASSLVTFETNARHELRSAQIRLWAHTEVQAIKLATDLVLPMLSWLSYACNVAVDVVGYEVYEETTDVRTFRIGQLGEPRPIPPFPALQPSTPEFRRVLSAYREALNSTNPFYQIICLDRVIEGSLKIRAARHAAALANGTIPTDPRERIPMAGDPMYATPNGPSMEFDPLSFQRFYGQKFSRVRQETERVVRNAIAHLDPRGDSLSADSYQDRMDCQVLAPVLRYIARTMLDHELALDPVMSEGAPRPQPT